MKRFFKKAAFVALILCIISSQAFAYLNTKPTNGYDIYWSDDAILYDFLNYYFESYNNAVAVVSPDAIAYRYQSIISYDDLAAMVFEANEYGFNVTLHRNTNAGYWVGYVYDIDYNVLDGGMKSPGVLSNKNGYVYVAEIDTTGEDSVDLLSQILTRLILVESYVKSTYFELWEQGGVLDDIYDVIDSIDSYVYDIKDRLYYNGKSAAYYLYKIESHLATIANNSGSSDGSSSPTDLSGVLGLLETISGYIYDIGCFASEISVTVHSSDSTLSDLILDMDSVLSNQASTVQYLFWIDSEVEDILEELKTATGNLSSVLSVLQQISDRLYYPDAGIDYYVFQIYKTLVNKLDTVIGNQEAILALLQEEGAFTTDISGVLENQQDVVDTLTSITSSLSSDGSIVSALNDLGLTTAVNIGLLQGKVIDGNMVLEDIRNILGNDQSWFNKRLESMITLLTNISDALSADGYIGDELHDIAVDTKLIYIKLGAFQEQQNTLVDQIAKSLKHNNYSVAYYVWALGGLVEGSFESVLANQSTALPVLQSMSESLTTISDRLYYVDASVSYYVYNISRQLRDKLPVLISNQEAGLANQQKLIDLIEDLELTTNVTIENIENITIDVTNKAYEVFYITDSEGNEQNLADFSGDVLTISGRLLNFFFKVAFDDAMDSVDSALDDMTEFYLDDSVVVGGSSLWE